MLDVLPEALPLNLELKRRRADSVRLAEVLATTVGERPHLLVSSFDWALLARVLQLRPESALAPIGGSAADPGELLAIAADLDAWSIHCNATLVDEALTAAAAAAGRPVLAYTVNDALEARHLFGLGVSGVFSDYPGRLRRQLEELP